MHLPTLWEQGSIIQTISDINPQLASWDKRNHPSQIRLRRFLDTIIEQLHPLPVADSPLFLSMDVDVHNQENLLKYHDLENYLTPLFGSLVFPAARFVFVTSRKYVGGGSKLQIGIARRVTNNPTSEGWNHFGFTAQASIQSKEWKSNLRDALAATNPVAATAPAVEVQLAWKCSARHNWVNLWKPTGDCMGPILGQENPLRSFAPNDDRITSLKLHRALDMTLGNAVEISMWWRDAPTHQTD